MIATSVTRLDALRPSYRFRDARTGRFVSRLFALAFPQYTVKEKK